MSLNRLALRLATIIALTNNESAPYPTIAGARVFDSRGDALQMYRDLERAPVISVYTDGDMGQALSPNNGMVDGLRRTVTLAIEMSVCSFSEDDAVIAETDDQVEAMLDVLEYQVRAALFHSDWTGLWLGLMTRGPKSWTTDRYKVPEDARIRAAQRVVFAEIEIPDDAVDYAVIEPGGSAPAPALPYHIQSFIDAVLASNPSSYVQQWVDMMTALGATPQAVSVPMIEKVRFIESDQAELNEMDEPKGDRHAGVAEADMT